MSKKDAVYEMVTARIVEALEAGNLPPWRTPWRNAGIGADFSCNTASAYRGINAFILPMVRYSKGYELPAWLTFKQAKNFGGGVNKGEHGTPITFFKMTKVEDPETREPRVFPVLRYYTVFNLAQTHDVKLPRRSADLLARSESKDDSAEAPDPIGACEQIVASWQTRPTIRHMPGRAFYTPATDVVSVPALSDYENAEEYYSTLFHELGHSTGAPKRLDRFEPGKFGSHAYGREELVAEMTSAFLCARAGISPAVVENQEAYIDSWRRTIKADVRAVVVAAGKAQKAADLVLNVPAYNEQENAA